MGIVSPRPLADGLLDSPLSESCPSSPGVDTADSSNDSTSGVTCTMSESTQPDINTLGVARAPSGLCLTETEDASGAFSEIDTPSPNRAVWRIDSEIATLPPHGHERALIPWDASWEGDQVLDDVLEVSAGVKCFQGDQFLVNQELFGFVSTFKSDMSQYTTPLDISTVPVTIQEKAHRLAREIELKHKGLSPEDAGIDGDEDEEALWSSVPRGVKDVESQPKACHRVTKNRSRTSTSVSTASTASTASTVQGSTEPSIPASTMRGTFMHIDGVGLVEQQIHGHLHPYHMVNSMPWMLQQCYGEVPHQTCTAVGQWPGTQVLTTCASSRLPSAQSYIPSGTEVGGIPSGTEVVIEGLVKAQAFNGLRGIVESFDDCSGRYNVRLQSSSDDKRLSKIKIENLRLIAPAGWPLPYYE